MNETTNLLKLDAELTRVSLAIKGATAGTVSSTVAVEEAFRFVCKNANLIRELVDKELGRS
jgi:hypothetical protein